MSLETALAENTAALAANTAALIALRQGAPATETKTAKVEKKAAAPAEEKKAEAPKDETPAPTIADIRAAAQKILDAGGPKHIRPLLTKYGVEKISAAPVEKYPEVLIDLAAALKKTEDEAKAATVV